LKEKPVVNHCGHDMSGADYRSQVVKSLCNTDWKSDSITMIAAMFRYKIKLLKSSALKYSYSLSTGSYLLSVKSSNRWWINCLTA
jgi:FANCI solenoid 1